MNEKTFKKLFEEYKRANSGKYKEDEEGKEWNDILGKWEDYRKKIIENKLELSDWLRYEEKDNRIIDNYEEHGGTLCGFINNPKNGYKDAQGEYNKGFSFFAATGAHPDHMMINSVIDKDRKVKYKKGKDDSDPNAVKKEFESIKALLKDIVDKDLEELKTFSSEKRYNKDFKSQTFLMAISILEYLRNDDLSHYNSFMWMTAKEKIADLEEMLLGERSDDQTLLCRNFAVYEKAKELSGVGITKDKKEIYFLNKFLWELAVTDLSLFTDFLNPNVILSGAPATGKTYTVQKTINNVLRMNSNQSTASADTSEEIKNTVNEYKKAEAELTKNGLDDNPKSEEAAKKVEQLENGLELARKIKRLCAGNSDEIKPVFSQFHPSYTYQDFIEGIKPSGIDKNGNLKLEVKNGSFKQFCIDVREANEKMWDELTNKGINKPNPDKQETLTEWPHYYYVVDEINRGNLSGIFGETFTLLEYRDFDFSGNYDRPDDDDRPNCYIETTLSSLIDTLDNNEDLIYKKVNKNVVFGIPFNIHFIGMMNDVDRSIDAFDLAFRRRFRWKATYCEYDIIQSELIDKGFEEQSVFAYVESCKKLNYAITGDEIDKPESGANNKFNMGLTYEIGHGYFIKIKNISSTKKITGASKGTLFDSFLAGTIKEYLSQNNSEGKELDKNLNELRKIFTGKADG